MQTAGTNARFNTLRGIAADALGNLYVADNLNNRIRKIDPSGIVSTLAGSGLAGSTDGPGTSASFNRPHGVALDTAGNVYVTEDSSFMIRKITPSGMVSTFAGGNKGFSDGSGINAQFISPIALAIDGQGNLYVTDENRIRLITPGGIVSTFTGNANSGADDGTLTSATFNTPWGIKIDASGNLYVVDYGNNKIRLITPDGTVSTLAGNGTAGSTDGTGAVASFNTPTGIAIDIAGNIYVSDYANHKIRKVIPDN